MKLLYEDELARALAEDGSSASTYITPKNYYPNIQEKKRGYFKLTQTIGKKFVKEQKALKKLLDKKKGKDLDWEDVKKSSKIFTKK